MKKLLILSALAATAALVYAQTAPSNLAKVESQDGLMLFVRSMPAGDHEVLGVVNMPAIVNSDAAGPMITLAIKRCQKQYPSANAIILQGQSLDKVKAIIVK